MFENIASGCQIVRLYVGSDVIILSKYKHFFNQYNRIDLVNHACLIVLVMKHLSF